VRSLTCKCHVFSFMFFRPLERKQRQKQSRLWHPAHKPKCQQWSANSRFSCGQCRRTFASRPAVRRHKLSYHDPAKEVTRRFKQGMLADGLTAYQRQNHRLSAAGLPRRKVRGRPARTIHCCMHCERQFDTHARRGTISASVKQRKP
jgi:hypothetical protein